MTTVSIICNTYNHEKYIQQCIEGFIIQKTTFSIEILIHDDCSTDNTPKIIREYETKYPKIIKPIYSNENLFSKGKKNLIRQRQYVRAKGKYIAHCEGDDYWTDPYKLQKQVDFLESNPDYVLTCHNYATVDFQGELLNTHKHIVSQDIFLESFISNYIISNHTIVYKNCLKFNGKDPKGYRDIFLFAQLLEKGKGFYFNENMSCYREHNGGVWSSLNEIKSLKHNLDTSYYLNKYFKFKVKSIDEFCYYTHKGYIFKLIEENRKLNNEFITVFRFFKLYRNRITHAEKKTILKNIFHF